MLDETTRGQNAAGPRRVRGQSFKETLLDRLEALPREAIPSAKPYGSSQQAKGHALRDAEALIAGAAARRAAVAWSLARRTTLPQRWIAERLA